MANWQCVVKIKDLHDAHRAEEMDIVEVASKVADRLQASPFGSDADLADLIQELRDCVETVEDYDWYSQRDL